MKPESTYSATKIYTMKNCCSIHYWMPGKYLNDQALAELHERLVNLNKSSGHNIDNRMLYANLSLPEMRFYLADCVISELQVDNEIIGFLFSPVIIGEGNPIVHAGLIIIKENPGGDLISLAACGNILIAHKALGTIFFTNISSTPSIIESFCRISANPWPSPSANLKAPPKEYREVVHRLKTKYIDKYFPDSNEVRIDYSRFTMTSNSTDMGFSTNYYLMSRANNFIFNSFCLSWVNYDIEEDIIQVGSFDKLSALRVSIMFFIARMKLRKNISVNNKLETLEAS